MQALAVSLTGALTEALPLAWNRIAAQSGEETADSLRQSLDDRGLRPEAESLFCLSPFLVDQVARNASWLASEAGSQWLEADHRGGSSWDEWLQQQLANPDSDEAFMAALRRFRGREMLRVVWRDFSRRADLDATLTDVTCLADACIRAAVARATRQLAARFGEPLGEESGAVQELVVLGMGKLGGEELNLSSDIDLIFTYPESGQTAGGRKQISNQEFFVRVGQLVIKYLDASTADGFVFRVDMRLRPYGDSGALVSNYDALELYYQEQCREWERYAFMKARAVTGSETARAPLEAMIRAFVYRRYTDFGVIDSLRDMKAMIVSEVNRLGLDDNVKKGSGGIREIEFIAQCQQLIHGGRVPALQVRGLEAALDSIAANGLLEFPVVDELRQAYRWLRNCEHALQGMEDRQTQTLPSDDLPRERLAAVMGMPDWQALSTTLADYRSQVADHFDALVAGEDHGRSSTEAAPETVDLTEAFLDKVGFEDVPATWGLLSEFRASRHVAGLQGDGRARMERFLPRFVTAAAQTEAPDLAVSRLLPFVASVSRRSAYLVLLDENPPALDRLIRLALRSQWIADKLASRPDLLDELLDAERLTTAPEREDIQSLLRQQLLRIPEDDLEAQIMALGRIKDGIVLRVAASELLGSLPLMKVSDYLTYLAEVILEHAIHVARAELVGKYGEPEGADAGFAVLGYGKLGGIELSYGSDLDVVFVYAGEGVTSGPKVIDSARFYTRLAQRVVHVLGTQMTAGRLYEVDLRLRPHGNSGLVAVSLSGFRKYQMESAWIWEHQALVRTRVVAGDANLCEKLRALRHEILCLQRDPVTLRDEVVGMRRKMLTEGLNRKKAPEGYFDLKRDPGGIVDVEFVVQYAVLANANRLPQLTDWSDVVRISESLEHAGVMPPDQASAIRAAYLDYRSAVHVTVLSGERPLGLVDNYRQHLETVTAIREQWLPGITGD